MSQEQVENPSPISDQEREQRLIDTNIETYARVFGIDIQTLRKQIDLFLKVFGFKNEEYNFDKTKEFGELLNMLVNFKALLDDFENKLPRNLEEVASQYPPNQENRELIIRIYSLMKSLDNFKKSKLYLEFKNVINKSTQEDIGYIVAARNAFKYIVDDKIDFFTTQFEHHWQKVFGVQDSRIKVLMSEDYEKRDGNKKTESKKTDQEKFGNFAKYLSVSEKDLVNAVVTGDIDRGDRKEDRDAAYQERFRRMKEQAKSDERVERILPIVENIYMMWVFTILEKGSTINIDNLTVYWETLSSKLEGSSKGLRYYDDMRTSEFYQTLIGPLTERMFYQMCGLIKDSSGKTSRAFLGSDAWNDGDKLASLCHAQLFKESESYRNYILSFGDKRKNAEDLLLEVAGYDASFRDLRGKASMWLEGINQSAPKHKEGDSSLAVKALLKSSYDIKNHDLGKFATFFGMGVDVYSDPIRSLITKGYYINKNTREKIRPGEILNPSDHILFIPFENSEDINNKIKKLNQELTREKRQYGESKKYEKIKKEIESLKQRLILVIKEQGKAENIKYDKFGMTFKVIDSESDVSTRNQEKRDFKKEFEKKATSNPNARISEETEGTYLSATVLYPEKVQNYLERLFGFDVNISSSLMDLRDLFLVPPVDEFLKSPLLLENDIHSKIQSLKKNVENSDDDDRQQNRENVDIQILSLVDGGLTLVRDPQNNMANYKKARSSVEWLFDKATTAMASKIEIPEHNEHLTKQKFRDLAKDFGTNLAMAMGYPWNKPYDYSGQIDTYLELIGVLDRAIKNPNIDLEKKEKYKKEKQKFEQIINESKKNNYTEKARQRQEDMVMFFKHLTKMYMIAIFAHLPWDNSLRFAGNFMAKFNEKLKHYKEIVKVMIDETKSYASKNNSLENYGLKYGFLDMLEEEAVKMFTRNPDKFRTDNTHYWTKDEEIEHRAKVDKGHHSSSPLSNIKNYFIGQRAGVRRRNEFPQYPFSFETKDNK